MTGSRLELDRRTRDVAKEIRSLTAEQRRRLGQLLCQKAIAAAFDPVPELLDPLLEAIEALSPPSDELVATVAALASMKDEEYFAAGPSDRAALFRQARALDAAHRFVTDYDSVLEVTYEVIIGSGLGIAELNAAIELATAF